MNNFDHVGFTVSDLDHAIDFYSLLLKRKPLLRRVYQEAYIAAVIGYDQVELDTAFFELPGASTILELIEYRQPPTSRVNMETYNVGNCHLCLVVGRLEDEMRRLADSGATFRSKAPVLIPAGPYQGGRALYLRDPDGISVQLIEAPTGGAHFSASAT